MLSNRGSVKLETQATYLTSKYTRWYNDFIDSEPQFIKCKMLQNVEDIPKGS